MQKLNSQVTDENNFFQGISPYELIEKYGSPLYVYNEKILRQRCRELKNLTTYPNFSVNYSAKANSSLSILQIIREEGLDVDAMSPGEIYVEMKAGFSSEQIFFVCNNVSREEMKYAIDNDILTSVDSISQLEKYGRLNPGGRVAARFNPGIGAGHHEKVVTAGKNTKFGIHPDQIPEVKNLLKKYDLKLVGINQHIGSLFMEANAFMESIKSILEIAKKFKSLEFIDLGGGFGIPYNKQASEKRLELSLIGKRLDEVFSQFALEYGDMIRFKIEPGRYVAAECGLLLGKVQAVKNNEDKKYIGTDLGFNVLARPVMYDSHHDIEIYRLNDKASEKDEKVTVVGNICESGDIIAKERTLPEIFEGDLLGVLDAGAYGHVMSSNYNNRLRPAEVLIREDGECVLIRKRDTLEDIVRNYVSL